MKGNFRLVLYIADRIEKDIEVHEKEIIQQYIRLRKIGEDSKLIWELYLIIEPRITKLPQNQYYAWNKKFNSGWYYGENGARRKIIQMPSFKSKYKINRSNKDLK